MEDRFERETLGLIRSWEKYDRAHLRDYLVQDVEDPNINVQSVLTRHFLIGRLYPGRFGELMDHELRFAACMNWLLAMFKDPRRRGTEEALFDALLDGTAAEGDDAEAPAFVQETFDLLPCEADGVEVPNYVIDSLLRPPDSGDRPALNAYVAATFQGLWLAVLAAEPAARLSVLEPACGSANDSRALAAFGLARWLDYAGFDLCQKNVRNALELLPAVRFEIGNVLEIRVPDDAYDCLFVHDLLEHLSVEGMERAIAEMVRVTRRALCVHFFNMDARAEHLVQPVEDYHWSRLSLPRTREAFERLGGRVEAVGVAELLRSRFGCETMHNANAHTFFVEL